MVAGDKPICMHSGPGSRLSSGTVFPVTASPVEPKQVLSSVHPEPWGLLIDQGLPVPWVPCTLVYPSPTAYLTQIWDHEES
jgi:hypothetical protein